MPRSHQGVSGDADRQGQSSLSSEPLLNEEQRLALEAALSGSLAEKTGATFECFVFSWLVADGLEGKFVQTSWMDLPRRVTSSLLVEYMKYIEVLDC